MNKVCISITMTGCVKQDGELVIINYSAAYKMPRSMVPQKKDYFSD